MTTFQGEEPYLKRMLESFVRYWPCKLIAYYEVKPDFDHEKIEYRDFFSINGIEAYLERIKNTPGSDGYIESGYDYRFDASKFCRKVFAQNEVFPEDSEIFWIGADVITHRDVPKDFLDGLIAGVPFCYLGRTNTWTETDFLGFNTKHPDFQRFSGKYLPYFTMGWIFQRTDGWHDCYAFDWAREGIEGRNLTPKGKDVDHVFVTSVLGKYMDHLKGQKRKQLGYSPEHPNRF